MRVLNGFRGLAVLLVFTAHTPLRKLLGDFGQPAVYLFFFLSAFLLTVSLLKEPKELVKFYKKRFFRIYPLFFILVTILYLLDLSGYSLKDLLINYAFMRGFIKAPLVIDVTWTLIIEVQFYICLPLIVKWLFYKDKLRIWAVSTAIVIPYIIRFIQYDYYITRVNSMRVIDGNLLEVLDLFVLGCVLAHLYLYPRKWKLKAPAFVTALVVGVFLGTPALAELAGISRPLTVLGVLIPVYSVCISYLFYFTVISPTWVNRLLGNRILDFYCMVSYSFYLLHLPVLQFARGFGATALQSILLGGGAFVATSILSYITYKAIEEPFMKLGKTGMGRSQVVYMMKEKDAS